MLVFTIRSHAPLDVVVDLMKPDEAIVSVSASHEAALFPLPPLCAQLGLSCFFFFSVFSYKNEQKNGNAGSHSSTWRQRWSLI